MRRLSNHPQFLKLAAEFETNAQSMIETARTLIADGYEAELLTSDLAARVPLMVKVQKGFGFENESLLPDYGLL